MSSRTQLYVGAVAPDSFAMTITPGDSGLDLSTVTAATFSVLKPSGTETTWTAVLADQSASSVTLTHPFQAAPSELDTEGEWRVYAILTIPGGYMRTTTVVLEVLGEYA